MRYAMTRCASQYREPEPVLFCPACAAAIGLPPRADHYWEAVPLADGEAFRCDRCATATADATPSAGASRALQAAAAAANRPAARYAVNVNRCRAHLTTDDLGAARAHADRKAAAARFTGDIYVWDLRSGAIVYRA